MPQFQAQKGQIDFTYARFAPVVNCVLKFQDKILLVKRSPNLNFYPNCWNGISGFLDDDKNLEEKALMEIEEELGLKKENIIKIKTGEIFEQNDPKYQKIWIVHPLLVEVNTEEVQLDWEAKTYQWLKFDEINTLNLLPGFRLVLEKLSSYLS